MLRLRSSILAHLLSSPTTSPVSQLHRLLSAAALHISPTPSFAVQDYLVGTCGLTPAQALKASAKISHIKSPTKPDAVHAFLAGLSLSRADVAALVAKDPLFLCAGMERILAPNVVGLTGLGFSNTEIARLVSLAPHYFRHTTTIVSKLQCYLSLLGSCENVVRILKPSSYYILTASLDRVVKPNVAFLRECGIDARGISSMCLAVPRILGTKPKRVRDMAARAEAVGVRCGSGMFRHALHAVAFLSEEKIAVKVEHLKKTFRWSDAEVAILVSRLPMVLKISKDMLQSKSKFLISELGLEPAYIAHRPVLLGLSLEGRLRPRYYVMKFLKENGLIDRDRSYYSSLMPAEKVFVEKYIHPYKGTAPHLAEDYAAACRGEVPTRFRFT